eukprot:751413-Hanusia_phi.AAC.4
MFAGWDIVEQTSQIRSSDTLGNVLPPVAREVEPPGYFQVHLLLGGVRRRKVWRFGLLNFPLQIQFDGSLKHDQGTTLDLEATHFPCYLALLKIRRVVAGPQHGQAPSR